MRPLRTRLQRRGTRPRLNIPRYFLDNTGNGGVIGNLSENDERQYCPCVVPLHDCLCVFKRKAEAHEVDDDNEQRFSLPRAVNDQQLAQPACFGNEGADSFHVCVHVVCIDVLSR